MPELPTSLVHWESDVEITKPLGVGKDAFANDMASIETVAMPGTRKLECMIKCRDGVDDSENGMRL